jgi:hypothetical protein
MDREDKFKPRKDFRILLSATLAFETRDHQMDSVSIMSVADFNDAPPTPRASGSFSALTIKEEHLRSGPYLISCKQSFLVDTRVMASSYI